MTLDRLSSGWGKGGDYSRYLMPKVGSLTVPVICSSHGHVSIFSGKIHVICPFFPIIRKFHCSWDIVSSVIPVSMGFSVRNSCRSFRAYYLRFASASFTMETCCSATASAPMTRYFYRNYLHVAGFRFTYASFLF